MGLSHACLLRIDAIKNIDPALIMCTLLCEGKIAIIVLHVSPKTLLTGTRCDTTVVT